MISNHNSTLQISRSDLLGWSTTSSFSVQLKEPAAPCLCIKELFEMEEISMNSVEKGQRCSCTLLLQGCHLPCVFVLFCCFLFNVYCQQSENGLHTGTDQHLNVFLVFFCAFMQQFITEWNPECKTSITPHMAATKIKVESCSLIALRRDYSTDRERARWLTALTHCESMPRHPR